LDVIYVRICYVLLSPTFGMHQYTADMANRMARSGHEVHLVTTSRHPSDRYSPEVRVYTPVETTNTGFSLESLRLGALRRVRAAICRLKPNVVHFTGPHLWNALLVRSLTARGIPAVHTLHDLNPHSGTRYGVALYAWNRLIVRSVDHNTFQALLDRKDVRPGCVISLQTFGPYGANSHPHCHAIISDGAFSAD
jgi:hypothetical protein